LVQLVVAEPDDRDAPQGGVGLPITAAVEAVPVLDLAAAARDWAAAAQGSQRLFSVEAVRVIAGGDEQRGGDVGADAHDSYEVGCDGCGDALEPGVGGLELRIKELDPLGELAHRQSQDRGQGVVVSPDSEAVAGLDEVLRFEVPQSLTQFGGRSRPVPGAG